MCEQNGSLSLRHVAPAGFSGLGGGLHFLSSGWDLIAFPTLFPQLTECYSIQLSIPHASSTVAVSGLGQDREA